jgi:S-adenosylmethionine-diacylgycerolhomoserine-N-methlytransferase
MKLAKLERYYATHAAFYDLTRTHILRGRKRAIELLDARPGALVLDVGCGTGLNFPLLRRRDCSIVGIDYSEAMLERAHRRDPQASLRRGDFTRNHLGGPFERALATYALSLAESPEEAVRNVHRHLAPGGVFVVLDFHPLKAGLAPLDSLLAKWLELHKVRPELKIGAVLETLFEEVELFVAPLGYFAIHRARFPSKRVEEDPISP